MKRNSLMKKLNAMLLASAMTFSTISQFSTSAFAQETTAPYFRPNLVQEINRDVVNVQISNISKPDTEIFQGKNTRVVFDFSIQKDQIGDAFTLGEEIVIQTNIGELFDANWSELSNIEIIGAENKLLATVSFSADSIKFVIKEGAAGSDKLSGQVISLEKFIAKDLGATQEISVKGQLTIGNAQKEITFKYFNPNPILPSDLSPVDIDTSWKNAWSNSTKTGAGTYIEINPIGSMDLYGYYTYPQDQNPNRGQQITSYENFLVQDVIQDQGFIDKNSVKIYAAVPKIAVKEQDATYNGWYKVPAGTYYAARQGTIRYRIDKNTPEDHGQERLKYLTQNSGETYDQFYARIVSNPLQWGIYYNSATNTETFLCNFGGIGHSDPNLNNGIKYSDYGIDSAGQALGNENFLADSGPTAGNIVSYYIEFNSYYPDVEGVKNVENRVDCYNVTNTGSNRISGNTATFEINNGGGFGTIRKNELSLLLVDEDDNSISISNAKFKIQRLVNDQWVDTGIEEITDAVGRLKIKNFPNGTYKIVQLSTANGYVFNNNTYKASTNSQLVTVSENGEFTISDDNLFGVGTIVTNKKKESYKVQYEFKAENGEELPSEVMSLLPEDTTPYFEGDTIFAQKPTQSRVPVSDGAWKFVEYDADSKVANSNNANEDGVVTFIGTWTFEKSGNPDPGNPDPEKPNPDRPIDPNPDKPDPDPEKPNQPDQPVDPSDPNQPGKPNTPSNPNQPSNPNNPSNPTQPGKPDSSNPGKPNPNKPNKSETVDTGRRTNLLFCSLLLLVSGICTLGVILKLQKFNDEIR